MRPAVRIRGPHSAIRSPAKRLPTPLGMILCRCVKYTNVSSGEVIKRLERDGWMPRKGKGSHRVFTHPAKSGIVVVPHPRKDLMIGTLRNIHRQAGWVWGGR